MTNVVTRTHRWISALQVLFYASCQPLGKWKSEKRKFINDQTLMCITCVLTCCTFAFSFHFKALNAHYFSTQPNRLAVEIEMKTYQMEN